MWKSVLDTLSGDALEPSAVAAESPAALEQWNREHCGWFQQPADIRTLIYERLDDGRTLLACRLVSRFLAADLGPTAPFWERCVARNVAERRWQAYVINWRLRRGATSGLGRVWNRIVALTEEEPPAAALGLMPLVVANIAENQRRCVAAPKASNNENAWRIRKGLIDRITSTSHFVPIFGNALETTARKLVYRLMWGNEEAPPWFPVAGVFPGAGGMGGGVAFHVAGTEMRLAPFYSWEKDVKKSDPLVVMLSQSDGLTFVVDDGVMESETEQRSMCATINMVVEAAKPLAPILVLSFASGAHQCDARRVLTLLGLDTLSGRAICVRTVPESTDTGVAEGFEWLAETLAAK